MEDRIKVLFLTSDPFSDGAALRLDDEVRAIRDAFANGRTRRRVKLVPYFAERTRDLGDALMLHDPRILHFAGRGGALYLGDAHGRPGVVGKESLRSLLGILSEWIRVVVLNGCATLSATDALSEVVDYTIAMDQPLSDASSIVFARAFYGALATGKPVQAAFDLAVRGLDGGAAIPILRIRDGVDVSVPLIANRASAA